jgi:ribosomal protein L29
MKNKFKANELTNDDLKTAYAEAKEELRKLRFVSVTGKLEKPSNVKANKKKIAKILTIQHEYKLGIRKR